MKKPVVDYRQFRLSRLNQPEFSHLKLLLGWLLYFAAYFLTENLIPAENCYVVHSVLDDWIPFCEWFIIPYVLWYGLIVVSLLWFALYNTRGFRQLSTYIIITQAAAMLIYVLFPNRQDLRPEVFPRENFLTEIVGLLYRFDTNTNVCPSLHVAYSLGIASVWLREKQAGRVWKTAVVVLVILVCLSVAFVKQHSVVDAFVAIPVCILAEGIAFGKSWWLPRLRKKA